jgi:hypothetical protein
VSETGPGSDLSDTPPPSAHAPPPSTDAPPPTTEAPPLAAGPQDTDDTRGYHFRRYIRHPLTLSLGTTLVIAAFVGGTLAVGAAIGAAAAAVAALIVVGIVFALASSKAAKDFYRAYAAARGLTWSGGHEPLPAVTPLLRRGDDRYSENAFRGSLPGGLDGILSLYTYEEESTDSKGNRQTSYYHFTLVLADMPEVSPKLSKLYCNRKSGFKFLEGVEDTFRKNKRLELESEAFADHYEVFYGPQDDENWLRQLFSPSFIVWLTEQAPEHLAFELESGELCVNVKSHRGKAAELDEMCGVAAHVAERIRAEIAE